MPYKDPEAQKAAQKRHYEANKARYRDAQRRRRAQVGYRDGEYAKQAEARAAERATRPSKPPKAPAPRKVSKVARERVHRLSKRKQREAEEAAARREELIATQRQMKADALRRLGISP